MHKQRKIKLFYNNTIESLEKDVNEFIKDKELADVVVIKITPHGSFIAKVEYIEITEKGCWNCGNNTKGCEVKCNNYSEWGK